MLNVAYVGALYHPKGLKTLYYLTNDFTVPVNWFIFGWVTDHYKQYQCDNAVVYGPYRTTCELYDLLDYYNIDIVIMPNECPESFSYVLSELWEYKMPVLGTDRGSVCSRIEESGCGWICNPSKMGEKLKWINDNPNEIDIIVNRLYEYDVTSIESMYNNYKNLYDRLIKDK